MAKVFLVSNEHTKVGHNLSHIAIAADNIHVAVAYPVSSGSVRNRSEPRGAPDMRVKVTFGANWLLFN